MDNPLYLYDLEYKNVIGVDEAGRGPLADSRKRVFQSFSLGI